MPEGFKEHVHNDLEYVAVHDPQDEMAAASWLRASSDAKKFAPANNYIATSCSRVSSSIALVRL